MASECYWRCDIGGDICLGAPHYLADAYITLHIFDLGGGNYRINVGWGGMVVFDGCPTTYCTSFFHDFVGKPDCLKVDGLALTRNATVPEDCDTSGATVTITAWPF